MMKFIVPLISFLLGNANKLFKEPGQALTQQLVLHARAIAVLTVSTIASLVLFLVGSSFLVSHIVNQVEKDGIFQATTGFIIYTAMVVIAGGVLLYSLRRQTWLSALGMAATQSEPQAKKSGALESAVALLIMDFVEERQSRRTNHDADQV